MDGKLGTHTQLPGDAGFTVSRSNRAAAANDFQHPTAFVACSSLHVVTSCLAVLELHVLPCALICHMATADTATQMETSTNLTEY